MYLQGLTRKWIALSFPCRSGCRAKPLEWTRYFYSLKIELLETTRFPNLGTFSHHTCNFDDTLFVLAEFDLWLGCGSRCGWIVVRRGLWQRRAFNRYYVDLVKLFLFPIHRRSAFHVLFDKTFVCKLCINFLNRKEWLYLERTLRIDDRDEFNSGVHVIVIIFHDFANKFEVLTASRLDDLFFLVRDWLLFRFGIVILEIKAL